MRLRSESLTGPRGVGYRKTRSAHSGARHDLGESVAGLPQATVFGHWPTSSHRCAKTSGERRIPRLRRRRSSAHERLGRPRKRQKRPDARTGYWGASPHVDDPLMAAIEVGVVATASGAAVAPVNGEAFSPDGTPLATTSTRTRPRGRGTPGRVVPV